jgi:hypothetical protein
LGVGHGADDPIPEKKLHYGNLKDASEGFNKQTVRGWRRRAENRDEWRHTLREAKARKGL